AKSARPRHCNLPTGTCTTTHLRSTKERRTEMATRKVAQASRRQSGGRRGLKEHVHRVGGKKRTDNKKAELRYLPWSRVELEDLNPLLQRQLVVGQNIMLARVLLKKGCIVPLH